MSISAIILAGGKGTRLGGQDKGWLLCQGKPLIERVLERLQVQVDDIVISCNRNLPRYRRLGYPIVTDVEQTYRGPLAGIAAAAPLCRGEFILLSPCDTPKLPVDLAQRLEHALRHSKADAAVPSDASGPQHLSSLLRYQVMESAAAALAADRLAVKHWLATLNTVAVDFSDQPEAFSNINRHGDLPPDASTPV